jgi:phosphatidylglycerophosphate synthase
MAHKNIETSAIAPSRLGPDLRRSALRSVVVALAGLLGAALALGWALDLGTYYVPKVMAAYGLVLLILVLFLPGHRPHDRLGPANWVTLGRALIGALLFGLVGEGSGSALAWTAFALALVAETLDGVDGRLARRGGWASPFGARFDMETDALLVAILSLLVWSLDKAGVWVLAAGLLRYGFVAAGYPIPWLRSPLPASRWRQTVCVIQVLTLTAALAPVLPSPWSALVVGIGLVLLCHSFAADVVRLARSAGAVPSP